MKNEIENTSPLFENSEQENKDITIQQEPIKHNFIIVYDTIYKNYDLNNNEKAFLLFYLSRSPNFKTSKNGTMKLLKVSRRQYEQTIKSLQAKGYLKIERKGKNEYSYIVNQTPTLTDKQLTYEYLSKHATFNPELWRTLLHTRQINKETYDKLCDNLKNVANIKWLD